MSKELVQFLHSKLSPEHFAGAMMVLHGGGSDDPRDRAMDEPPRDRGRDVPQTGGAPAQDARYRKLVADGALRNLEEFRRHQESLGLRPIRNLGP